MKTNGWHKFRVEIYGINTKVYFGDDWSKEAKKCGVEIDLTDTTSLSAITGNNVYLFFYDDPSYSSLAHEIMHAVIYIAEYAGFSINDHTSETAAYLCSYLYGEVLGGWKKLLKKRNKGKKDAVKKRKK
jgi:hypothetical protein